MWNKTMGKIIFLRPSSCTEGEKKHSLDAVYEGVLGNKWAEQHSLKTVQIREIVSK
jgi:hypothetical protein